MATATIFKLNDTRVTKAMFLEDIAARLQGETPKHSIPLDMIGSFIKNELDLLARKNASSATKKGANAAEDERLKSLITDYLMTQNEPRNITEIWRGTPEIENSQKVTSLIGAMAKEGLVVKTIGKSKRSLYSLA